MRDEYRKNLEKQLSTRFIKKPRNGMAARLLKGEEVQKHLDTTFSEFSSKTNQTIDKKTQEAVASLTARIDAVLRYMQSVVDTKVQNMPVPQDGRTPSKEEITAALSPMVDETKKEFQERIAKIESLLSTPATETDVPQDLKGLEEFVKKQIPKDLGGGGGPGYLFELFDTPVKSKGLQGAYVDYKNKVLTVSADGKRLIWADGGGGSSLPDQTGQNGKFLTTDGTDPSWATLAGGGDMAAATYDPAGKSEQLLGISDIIDEDNMATDSATKVPTQQSVKAYVDANSGGASAIDDLTDVTITTPADNEVLAYDTGTSEFINQTPAEAGLQEVLAEGAFVDGDKTKLNGIEASADVTDTTNVTAAGALMDSEVTNLAQVKAFDSADYATAAQGTLADNAIPNSEKGANSGVAELDAGGKVPAAQLPSFVDDVLEYADLASFPATGETGKIYVAEDTNIVYRWSGTAYVEISASLALGETDSTAYRGDRGKVAYDHSQVTTGNPHNVLATQITDFDTEVANNSAVTANTAKVTNATHTGDVTGATELTIADGAVTLAKQADMATASVVYRKTAGAGAPEVNTLATLKTDLGLTGTNSGDQTLPTRDSLGLDTDDSPQFAGVELGHATDTTLTRSAAGVLAVEGVVIPSISSTNTLSNKRVTPRTASSTTAATLTPDLGSANVYYRTTQTATLTIEAPIGTPVIGETILIYVDSVGAETLTINSTYKAFGAAFPATTTAGKTFMLSAQYNGTDWKSLWANAV